MIGGVAAGGENRGKRSDLEQKVVNSGKLGSHPLNLLSLHSLPGSLTSVRSCVFSQQKGEILKLLQQRERGSPEAREMVLKRFKTLERVLEGETR